MREYGTFFRGLKFHQPKPWSCTSLSNNVTMDVHHLIKVFLKVFTERFHPNSSKSTHHSGGSSLEPPLPEVSSVSRQLPHSIETGHRTGQVLSLSKHTPHSVQTVYRPYNIRLSWLQQSCALFITIVPCFWRDHQYICHIRCHKNFCMISKSC